MSAPLSFALGELAAGVAEATGANDGVPAERYNDGEQKPWCASFVRWCFEQARTPLPGRRALLPAVKYLEEQLRLRGARVDVPAAGDVVCFALRVGSDAGPGRHVGIVETVTRDARGLVITTVEGNSGNRVARRSYRAKDPRITGFYRWPR